MRHRKVWYGIHELKINPEDGYSESITLGSNAHTVREEIFWEPGNERVLVVVRYTTMEKVG